MAAYVADEIDADAPLGEAPLPVGAFEAVTVPAADDGLQRQAGQRLQHGEVRARDRRARFLVDFDGDIRGDMLGPGRAVVVDDQHVPEHLLDGIGAANRRAAAREDGVGEQGAEAREIAVVHKLGVSGDQVPDGPVARRLIAGDAGGYGRGYRLRRTGPSGQRGGRKPVARWALP